MFEHARAGLCLCIQMCTPMVCVSLQLQEMFGAGGGPELPFSSH